MSTLNSILNPTMSRRSMIAGAAGLGVMGALAGCSSSSSSSSDGSSTSTEGAFKIGMIGPLTGAAATYGVSAKQGAELAVKDFSGDDYTFEIKSEDDQADGEKGVTAFNTLADWGMQALVGPVTTGAAVAVSGEIADDMLMITPSASSLDVTKGKTTVFQVCFTDPTMGTSAAKFLAENYPDEKIALFYNSGDTYSSGIADAFKEQAEESKLDIVDTETFKDDSSTSFTNQLTTAKEAGATFIFAPIYYTPASVLLKNASDMGYEMTMMGTDGMDGILSVEGFDTSLAEGLLLMTPFSADDEKNADFVAAYEDAYGETPNQFAADGYDCVHAIYEALKKAELGSDVDPAEAATALADAMREITVEGLTGELSWNDEGQVEKPATAYVIKNGKYITA